MMLRVILQRHLSIVQGSTCVMPSLSAYQKFLHSSSYNSSTALEEVKEKERSVQPYSPEPKGKMEPYVKNLFIGKIDPNVFMYPEFDLGVVNILDDMVSEVEKFMESETISAFNPMQKVSADTILKLKELGLFKVNIAKQYGGLELNYAEILRLTEVLSRDLSLFQTMNTHIHYVSTVFNSYASEEQKEKYLPSLASGDVQFGLAVWEKNAGIDVSTLDCSASFVGDVYLLSGTKQWVCNGGIADKLLVFAREKRSSFKEGADSLTCLMVDSNSEGVSAKSLDTLGVNGYNTWEVTFDKTPVPKENIIGGSGQGLSILKSIFHGKFTLAGSCTGLLRDLYNTTLNHAINRETFGKPLIEYDLIKAQLAEIASRIYALESASYLTAYFYEDFEDPDCDVEAAIIKVYSSETLLWVVQKCCSILGSDTYLKDKPYEHILRDALFSPLVETSADTLRMSIGLQCIQHVGFELNDYIMETRNPLYYPQKAFKSFIDTNLFSMKDEDYKGIIFEHVHPSMEGTASALEHSIIDLRRNMEQTLTKWGSEIEKKQQNLERVANIAIDLYLSTAVLGRASRAYSIGLRNCDTDVNLASFFVQNACGRIKFNLEQLEASPFGNSDTTALNIANNVIHERKYFAAHPLARSY